MVPHRQINCCAFLLTFLGLAFSLPAAEAPLPPEVQQKLDVLTAGYEAFALKSVSIPYEEGFKALNAKVRPALERESTAAAKRKDLAGLVRIKADLERIDKNEVLPDADDSQLAAPLVVFYTTYKNELAKLDAARKTNFADAKQRYDKGLAQVQDVMTTSKQVDAALHIKKMRDDLVKVDNPPSPQSAPAGNSAPGTPAAADGLAAVEMIGELGTFEDGAMPYTNRQQPVFAVAKAPATLKGLSFIKVARALKTVSNIKVTKPGRIYVACCELDRGAKTVVDQEYLVSQGFEKAKMSFVVNDMSLAVYRKEVDKSLTLNPADANCGFFVIGNITATAQESKPAPKAGEQAK